MKKVMSIMIATLISASVIAANAPANNNVETTPVDSAAKEKTELLQKENAKLVNENEILKMELGYTKMMSNMLLKLKAEPLDMISVSNATLELGYTKMMSNMLLQLKDCSNGSSM